MLKSYHTNILVVVFMSSVFICDCSYGFYTQFLLAHNYSASFCTRAKLCAFSMKSVALLYFRSLEQCSHYIGCVSSFCHLY